MKKLYKKSELYFAITLIVVYVAGSSLMKKVSETIGINYMAEIIFNFAISAVIIIFAKKNNIMKHIGLCKTEVSAKKMLFYIPLFLIASAGGFFGIAFDISPLELAMRTLMMIFVGFLEEVIFRGFLFRGIAKDNLKEAIIISSVTFGIGHIVNLLNGYELVENIIQIVFAVAAGFMLVFIFVRTGSIIPCIIFHAYNNSVSAVISAGFLKNALGSDSAAHILLAAIAIVIAVSYTLYIVKALPERKLAD